MPVPVFVLWLQALTNVYMFITAVQIFITLIAKKRFPLRDF